MKDFCRERKRIVVRYERIRHTRYFLRVGSGGYVNHAKNSEESNTDIFFPKNELNRVC